MRVMKWEDNNTLPVTECSCDLVCACALIVPMAKLQQNLALVAAAAPELGERYALAEEINKASNAHIERTDKLKERMNLYLEHHNALEEQRLDLIATASAPPNVNDLGHRVGWDRVANDSPSRRTLHKLKAVEAETNRQLNHATEMLTALKDHEREHKRVHGVMEKSSGEYSDFQEAVAHSRTLGQKEIDKYKATLSEHIGGHKRWSRLIQSARKSK